MQIIAAWLLLFWAGVVWGDYAEHTEAQAFIDELVAEHDYDRAELERVFAKAERKERILEAIARPAERTKPWFEYRDIFVTDSRIREGVGFWRENAAALDRAHQIYGVAPEMVVAIIGVETRYGRHAGSYRVVDALSTLAFDYPPRAKFFRSELQHFFLLAREEGKDPLDLMGSYAGAMGYGQFIPSSFRAYAVDFDGDGVRDIWGNATDAIGSVANYFSRHGWRGDGPAALQVELAAGDADGLANQGLALKHDVGALRQRGVAIAAVPDDAKAALFRMEGEAGNEYWLGLHDFYVITRYNRSQMYALAVLQLGEAISAQLAARASDSTMELAADDGR